MLERIKQHTIYIIFICNAILHVYLSYLLYVIIMNIMYYVMLYFIICICLHPIQSRRCIMIIAYDRYAFFTCTLFSHGVA